MTTTRHPSLDERGVQSTQPSTRRLVRVGALTGAIAAVCTTVVAAIASAADVSLEVDATAIPIPAIAAPDHTATKAVLVGNHLLAAAIIIPTLSRRLTAVD
jgi:hypothetical protein